MAGKVTTIYLKYAQADYLAKKAEELSVSTSCFTRFLVNWFMLVDGDMEKKEGKSWLHAMILNHKNTHMEKN